MWRENQAGDRENDNFVIEVRSIVLSITRGRLEQNMERKKKKTMYIILSLGRWHENPCFTPAPCVERI